MKALIIKNEVDTPEIILDKENNKFSIIGRSIPENAVSFYRPVVDWLEEYANSPLPNTELQFRFDYFNTASAKQIAKIILIIEKISKTAKIKVKWFYPKGDIDMKLDGMRYKELTEIDIEIVEYI